MLKKMTRQVQIVAVVAVLLCGAWAGAVTLVEDGKPVAVIVTDAKPTIAAKLAALELQYHIEAMTGAALPIQTAVDGHKAGTVILVGESEATRKMGLKAADFKSQEYLIKIDAKTVVLMGCDWLDTLANRAEIGRGIADSLEQTRKKINYSEAIGKADAKDPIMLEVPGLMDEQGTCYAVYDFLERFCGVRWYGPAMFNSVIPPQKTLVVPEAAIRRTPSMLHRYGPGGDWPIVRRQWGKHHGSQRELFLRRIRYGGEKWGSNHAFTHYYDRFLNKESKIFEREEPGFFAVGYENEGQWRQLCYTNPDLIKQVVQDARDYFDGKGLKKGLIGVGDYFAVVPADTDHWCKCEKCQPILEKGKSRGKPGAFSTGLASDYIFGFVNEVAKELKKTHPDKYIAALAYWCYYEMPSFELELNVSVAPCMQTCYANTGVFRDEAKLYYPWVEESKRTGRRLYLWNYFHHPMERAIMGNYKCFPNFMADTISDWVKRYVRDGVRGFYLCGIGEQLDFCLYMQTAFNDTTDVTTYTDEFFTGYFGAAAEPMKTFYWRIADINRWQQNIGTTEKASWEKMGTEVRMKELGALMDNAIKLASTDLEKQRVESWRRGVWEYMQEGRQEYLKKQEAEKAAPPAK